MAASSVVEEMVVEQVGGDTACVKKHDLGTGEPEKPSLSVDTQGTKLTDQWMDQTSARLAELESKVATMISAGNTIQFRHDCQSKMVDQASSKITVLEAKSKSFAQASARVAELEKKVATVDQGIHDLWDAFYDGAQEKEEP